MQKKIQKAEDLANDASLEKALGDNSCFIIMSFSGNPILETYFEEAIRPTVMELQLRCVRIDKEHFDGTISDRIKNNIEKSSIVIVDLTEDRPNCYFEAGYAVALGKRIIFQRLDAPSYKPIFHFDVKDFPHILYSTASDLRKQLREKLNSLLNSG